MSVVFQPLQELGSSDLNILITNDAGTPVNPSDITYKIVYCEPCNPNGMVMPPENRTPANDGIGSFWADMQIPQGWPLGVYEVRWSWRLTASFPYTSAREAFQVVKLSSPIPQNVNLLDILTFVGPGSAEVGANVVTPAFTATYSLDPATLDSIFLFDSEGSTAKNVLVTPLAFTSDETFSKSTSLAKVTFSLQASDGFQTDSQDFDLSFLPRVYVDVDDPLTVGGGNEAFVKGFATSQLQSSVVAVHSVTVPTGKRIFIALPDSLGNPVFQIGNALLGGMTDINTFNVTADTPNAMPILYRLWMSQFGGFGATTLTVTEGP